MNKFYKQKFNTREISVLVSDEEESLRKALKNRIPAIACIGEDTEYKLSFVPYAVEDEGAIDEDYLRFVYCRTNGIPLEIARTERLLIRELCADDRDDVKIIFGDRKTNDDFDKEITQYIRNTYDLYGYGLYAVCLRSEDRLKEDCIGLAGLKPSEGSPELGYILKEPYRGYGYAYEACCVVLEKYREIATEKNIKIIISENNVPSVCLAKKLRDTYYPKGMLVEIQLV